MKFPLLAMVIVLLAPLSLPAGTCLDFSLPENHFDGVEEHGWVDYWEQIGEVRLADELTIPINICFRSDEEASSPYLGRGWRVAFLESRIIPIDANYLVQVMPDGWIYTFYRNGTTETWRGNYGWSGLSTGATFVITAPCGASIRYEGGKIQEIKTKEQRTITFHYVDRAVTSVDEDGKIFMQASGDPKTGVITNLVIDGQKIDIQLDKRPRVRTMTGPNTITGSDPSLALLSWPDGRKESFSFGTDHDLNPSLTIVHPDQSQRSFTWDARTKLIKTDGDWTYALHPTGAHWLPFAYERTNSKGQSEYFESNDLTGATIERTLDGVETRTYRATSGPAAGRVQKIERLKVTILQESTYDDQGRLIRTMDADGKITSFTYDASGQRQVVPENRPAPQTSTTR